MLGQVKLRSFDNPGPKLGQLVIVGSQRNVMWCSASKLIRSNVDNTGNR